MNRYFHLSPSLVSSVKRVSSSSVGKGMLTALSQRRYNSSNADENKNWDSADSFGNNNWNSVDKGESKWDTSSFDFSSSGDDKFSTIVDSKIDISATVDASNVVNSVLPSVLLPDPGFISSHIMNLIDNIHSIAGVPYWEAIVVVTLGMRLCLFPLAAKGIQNAARMSHLKPDMEKLMASFNDTDKNDPDIQKKYMQAGKDLYDKHQINPVRAMITPFLTFPPFLAFFFALRDMGIYYPGFATGGALWFTNLAAPDPLMIFPIVNAITFLAMIELGTDTGSMKPEQKVPFQWAMRGLGVAMVPLSLAFPQGLLVYWTTNNIFSLTQSVILKQPIVKAIFDIPEFNNPTTTSSSDSSPIVIVKQTMAEKLAAEKAKAVKGMMSGPNITSSTHAAADSKSSNNPPSNK